MLNRQLHVGPLQLFLCITSILPAPLQNTSGHFQHVQGRKNSRRSRCGPLWLYEHKVRRQSMPRQTYASAALQKTNKNVCIITPFTIPTCPLHCALQCVCVCVCQVTDRCRPRTFFFAPRPATTLMLITVRAKVLSLVLQLPNRFAHVSKYTRARWCQISRAAVFDTSHTVGQTFDSQYVITCHK